MPLNSSNSCPLCFLATLHHRSNSGSMCFLGSVSISSRRMQCIHHWLTTSRVEQISGMILRMPTVPFYLSNDYFLIPKSSSHLKICIYQFARFKVLLTLRFLLDPLKSELLASSLKIPPNTSMSKESHFFNLKLLYNILFCI